MVRLPCPLRAGPPDRLLKDEDDSEVRPPLQAQWCLTCPPDTPHRAESAHFPGGRGFLPDGRKAGLLSRHHGEVHGTEEGLPLARRPPRAGKAPS